MDRKHKRSEMGKEGMGEDGIHENEERSRLTWRRSKGKEYRSWDS